jgi:circadian clock protein KaiC
MVEVKNVVAPDMGDGTMGVQNVPPIVRVPTYVPGLDEILCGGLLKGGIYMLSGPPGAGKTILGNQIAYNHVARGGRALYVTLVAESHSRMIAHLRSLDYFNPEAVGEALYYISAYGVFEKEGLSGLLKMLRRLVLDRRATLMILDSLSLPDMGEKYDLKKFINELQVSIEAAGCTALVLTPAVRGEPGAPVSAQTMADGLIVLSDVPTGLRNIRQIEVVKFRGSKQLRGKHSFRIEESGIHVYPRTEALFDAAFSDGSQPQGGAGAKLEFGISKLDSMMRGGIPEGSSTMLLGVPGSGKTLLGLHYLTEGARNSERGLYFGFSENQDQLLQKGHGVSIPFEQWVSGGLLHIIWQPALENDLDVLAERLLKLVEETGAKRVFIDSLNGFVESATHPERIGSFIPALLYGLREAGATTVLSVEAPDLFSADIKLPVPELALALDNILLLRYVELEAQIYRLISVLKMRNSGHDRGIREFRINDDGIDVATTFESAEAILTGIARARSG